LVGVVTAAALCVKMPEGQIPGQRHPLQCVVNTAQYVPNLGRRVSSVEGGSQFLEPPIHAYIIAF